MLKLLKNPKTVFIIPLILILVWFREGFVYGGGEGGVPFLNFTYYAKFFNNAWNPSFLGNSTSWTITNYPLYLIFSTLERFGVPGFVNQASFFLAILLVSGFGIYNLVRYAFKNDKIAALSTVFYWLNFSALILVWNRFQMAFIAFYGLIPIISYFYLKGLIDKKFHYVLYVNIFLLILSFTFISIPTIVMTFLVLGIYSSLIILISDRKIKSILFVITFFVLTILLWLVFNIWWIIQFYLQMKGSAYVGSVALSTSVDVGTFRILSEKLGKIHYIIRQFDPEFFNINYRIIGLLFRNPIAITGTFIIPIIIFGSLFIKKKPRIYFLFLFFAILIVFLAKGMADPFGVVFYYIFTHIRIFEIFRNPYEKVGLILPLAMAPLFGYSLYHLAIYIRHKFRTKHKLLTSAIFIIIFGFFAWPLWTGMVFTSGEIPTNNPKVGDKIKIPTYYNEANKWLNRNSKDERLIALPLQGEGITHNWEYGYSGVELSNFLFDRPSISLCTGIEYLCPIASSLEQLLIQSPGNFWKSLPPLQANLVMVRSDIDFKLRNYSDPKNIKKYLSTEPNIKYIKDFGKLSFFSLNNSFRTGRIFATTSGIYVNGGLIDNKFSYIQAIPFANYAMNDIYITDDRSDRYKNEAQFIKQHIIKLDRFSKEDYQLHPETAILELPHVRYLPDSPFYFLTSLKETISLLLAGNDPTPDILKYSSKRLVETYKLAELGKYEKSNFNLQNYKSSIEKFLLNPQQLSNKEYREILLRQKYVLLDTIKLLKQENKPTFEFDQTYKLLSNLMRSLQIETTFPVDLDKFDSYSLTVPEDGLYKIVVSTQNWDKYYSSTKLTLIQDGEKSYEFIIDTNKYKYPEITLNLTEGYHQLDFERPTGINLVAAPKEIRVSTKLDKHISIPIENYKPYNRYRLSLSYKISKTGTIKVDVKQDSDPIVNGKVKPKIGILGYELPIDTKRNYDNYSSGSFVFNSDPISHSAEIEFSVLEGNSCLVKITRDNLKSCTENNINQRTDGELIAKDLKVVRELDDPIYAIKDTKAFKKLIVPKIIVREINPSKYEIDIQNASGPYVLAFLQSYNSLWRLYHPNSDTNQEIDESKHFLINSYANGWKIEKTGTYTLVLEYIPQSYLGKGIAISIIGIFIAIIIFIYIRYKSNI